MQGFRQYRYTKEEVDEIVTEMEERIDRKLKHLCNRIVDLERPPPTYCNSGPYKPTTPSYTPTNPTYSPT
jgi:hypothetical protein